MEGEKKEASSGNAGIKIEKCRRRIGLRNKKKKGCL